MIAGLSDRGASRWLLLSSLVVVLFLLAWHATGCARRARVLRASLSGLPREPSSRDAARRLEWLEAEGARRARLEKEEELERCAGVALVASFLVLLGLLWLS